MREKGQVWIERAFSLKKKNLGKRKGQVWIETVLYTLIGLALMGAALGFIMPKINEARDRALVEQAINSLSDLDARINEVIQTGTGNRRISELLLKKGELYFNASADEIILTLSDLSKPYSEPNVTIDIGRIKVRSELGQKRSKVYLRAIYNSNITYAGKDEDKKVSAATIPYRFYIDNRGPLGGKIWVDITE